MLDAGQKEWWLTNLVAYFYCMAPAANPQARTAYSLCEWFGEDVVHLDAAARRSLAKQVLSTQPQKANCPFHPRGVCNKKGGVCTLRLYRQEDNGPVQAAGSPVCVCPNRFYQGGLVRRWVGEVMLQTSEPVVLTEIGFLQRLRPAPEAAGLDSQGRAIGRIDCVLLHPSRNPLDWCALEMQAVYFSGAAMSAEFALLAQTQTDDFPFPAKERHPDWRSSGPKRLLPQLQTKTPAIRTWGKKVAVVVDEPFFQSLAGLEREKHLSNAEIVWFVVGFDWDRTSWRLAKREVVCTKLEASVKALTGGVPLSKEEFEAQLLNKLRGIAPDSPLLAAR